MATRNDLARKSVRALVQEVFDRRGQALRPLPYEELARRIGHLTSDGRPVAVSMGGILSIAGHLLEGVEDSWGSRVPHLTALAVAKEGRPDAGLPSPGMSEFWPSYPALTREEKLRKAAKEWDRITSFGSRWNDVLKALRLPEVSGPSVPEPTPTGPTLGAGGESPAHVALKAYVKAHPECVGASAEYRSDIEYALPSGDEIDVLFRSANEWISVEVKASTSDQLPRDYERGLYQTIKYYAVLAAMARAKPDSAPEKIRSVLVLQSKLPTDYHTLRDVLGITVVEGIGNL